MLCRSVKGCRRSISHNRRSCRFALAIRQLRTSKNHGVNDENNKAIGDALQFCCFELVMCPSKITQSPVEYLFYFDRWDLREVFVIVSDEHVRFPSIRETSSSLDRESRQHIKFSSTHIWRPIRTNLFHESLFNYFTLARANKFPLVFVRRKVLPFHSFVGIHNQCERMKFNSRAFSVDAFCASLPFIDNRLRYNNNWISKWMKTEWMNDSANEWMNKGSKERKEMNANCILHKLKCEITAFFLSFLSLFLSALVVFIGGKVFFSLLSIKLSNNFSHFCRQTHALD